MGGRVFSCGKIREWELSGNPDQILMSRIILSILCGSAACVFTSCVGLNPRAGAQTDPYAANGVAGPYNNYTPPAQTYPSAAQDPYAAGQYSQGGYGTAPVADSGSTGGGYSGGYSGGGAAAGGPRTRRLLPSHKGSGTSLHQSRVDGDIPNQGLAGAATGPMLDDVTSPPLRPPIFNIALHVAFADALAAGLLLLAI